MVKNISVAMMAGLALCHSPCAAQTVPSPAEPVWEESPASVQQLHSDKWITIRPEPGVEFDVPARSPTGIFYIQASQSDGSRAQLDRIVDRLGKGLMIEAACERYKTSWESTDLSPNLFPPTIRDYVEFAIAQGDRLSLSLDQCNARISDWNRAK